MKVFGVHLQTIQDEIMPFGGCQLLSHDDVHKM